MFDALSSLVPFVQFKKRENTYRRVPPFVLQLQATASRNILIAKLWQRYTFQYDLLCLLFFAVFSDFFENMLFFTESK